MAQPQQVNLDLGTGEDNEESNVAPSSGAPVTRTSTSTVTRTTNTGLGDRLNHVFREIRPLVEHARMGNNSRLSLPTWLPRSPVNPSTYTSDNVISASRPLSSVAHVNLGPTSQTYALNERLSPQRQASETSPAGETEGTRETDNLGEITISVNPANNNNIADAENESQSDDGTQQVLDVRGFLNVLIKYSPFYLILLVKFMYDRREGLFTFFLLIMSFFHSNCVVKKEYGKQANRSIVALLFELIYSMGIVALVQFLFGNGKLLQNVIMFPGFEEGFGVTDLIWLVCLTDLMVKIMTVNLKIVITVLPAVVLPFQKRGKVYLFIESISQLYRGMLPIQPWLTFLVHSYEGSEKMIGMFLCTAYVIAKVVELIVRLRLFKNATWTLLQSVNLGTKPTGEQLLSAGESCPICHDEYTTPVRLGCSHIFCELCIAAWLDREHTCPLCRAKVTDEPTWRDGSTTLYCQLY